MPIIPKLKKACFITTIAVFLLSFALFFYQTSEPIGSLFAAICSALLVLGSFIVIIWITQSIKRP